MPPKGSPAPGGRFSEPAVTDCSPAPPPIRLARAVSHAVRRRFVRHGTGHAHHASAPHAAARPARAVVANSGGCEHVPGALPPGPGAAPAGGAHAAAPGGGAAGYGSSYGAGGGGAGGGGAGIGGMGAGGMGAGGAAAGAGIAGLARSAAVGAALLAAAGGAYAGFSGASPGGDMPVAPAPFALTPDQGPLMPTLPGGPETTRTNPQDSALPATPIPVPEPPSLALLGLGVLAAALAAGRLPRLGQPSRRD